MFIFKAKFLLQFFNSLRLSFFLPAVEPKAQSSTGTSTKVQQNSMDNLNKI